MEGTTYTGVKVFSVTMARDRDRVGERVTQWMRENPAKQIVATKVLQSSDRQYHCVSVILFFKE